MSAYDISYFKDKSSFRSFMFTFVSGGERWPGADGFAWIQRTNWAEGKILHMLFSDL